MAEEANEGFVRSLGLYDSTTIVAGSMIGSGIFIVSADIARQTGSAGGTAFNLDYYRTSDGFCPALS